MYESLKVVTRKVDGSFVKFFSSYWRVAEWGNTLPAAERKLYGIETAYGWRKYWYLFKYPHIKIS